MAHRLTPPSKGTTPAPQPPFTEMAPPATPTTRERTLPQTPGSVSDNTDLNTPGGQANSPQTPGGSIRACTAEKSHYSVVTVHTAKCTECDHRNKDTMLRCPGCTFQICKPCREKRERRAKGLEHGSMSTPGGLQKFLGGNSGGGGLSGLMGRAGSGVVRKKLPGMAGSLSPSPAAGVKRSYSTAIKTEDSEMESEARDWIHGANDDEDLVPSSSGKGKEKAVSSTGKSTAKKRAAKSKPRAILVDDSSDDEYTFGENSPTVNKKRRFVMGLTDSPTATSARPSRRTSVPNHAYVPASSPASEDSRPEESSPAESSRAAETRRATENSRAAAESAAESSRAEANRFKDPHRSWNVGESNPPQVVPDARIQELLEMHGVNTSGNRYQEHFLSRRSAPVMSNPSIAMPASWMKKSSERQEAKEKEGSDAKAKEDQEAKAKKNEEEQEVMMEEYRVRMASNHTVRGFVESSTQPYLLSELTSDEREELLAKVLADARKWANRVYDHSLDNFEKQYVERGFQLRLDKINPIYREELSKLIKTSASSKLKEYDEDRRH